MNIDLSVISWMSIGGIIGIGIGAITKGFLSETGKNIAKYFSKEEKLKRIKEKENKLLLNYFRNNSRKVVTTFEVKNELFPEKHEDDVYDLIKHFENTTRYVKGVKGDDKIDWLIW
jgi:hypothetical protein